MREGFQNFYFAKKIIGTFENIINQKEVCNNELAKSQFINKKYFTEYQLMIQTIFIRFQIL